MIGRHLEHREIDLGVLAQQRGLEPRSVVEDDGDLIGIGDHVVVGHHDAGRIDDEARAERAHAPRRLRAVLIALAALAASVEEIAKKLIELRVVGQLRQRAAMRLHVLGSRDIDDRVDHLFGHIGYSVGSARQRRGNGQCQRCGRNQSQGRPTGPPGKLGKSAEHGHLSSWWIWNKDSAPVRLRTQGRSLGRTLALGLGRDFASSLPRGRPRALPDMGRAARRFEAGRTAADARNREAAP